jgi:hypothetical protein
MLKENLKNNGNEDPLDQTKLTKSKKAFPYIYNKYGNLKDDVIFQALRDSDQDETVANQMLDFLLKMLDKNKEGNNFFSKSSTP